MMTQKEQEEKVYEEFLLVKDEFESILKRKINKRNFKQAIVDVTAIAASGEFDVDPDIDEKKKDKISDFFTKCHLFLGDVVWKKHKKQSLSVTISYDNDAIVSWKIPIDLFFSESKQYQIGTALFTNSFKETFSGIFLSPELRELIVNGDEAAIKSLYSSFDRPSMQSSIANLKMLRDCFPDFYKHITKKLDVMTVEMMEQFQKNKLKQEKNSK